jgi:alkyl sulfatase BDS1-like metallo-beta-lactamase superfamily hydrolase
MRSTISYDTAVNLTIPQLFGVLATRLDGLAAQYATLTIAFHFTDLEQDWGLTLENGALTWMKGQSQDPTASLSLHKTALAAVVAGKNTMPESIAEGEITLQGDAAAIDQLSAWFEIPAPVFNVVEPKPGWAL